jgi:hypothetical protein
MLRPVTMYKTRLPQLRWLRALRENTHRAELLIEPPQFRCYFHQPGTRGLVMVGNADESRRHAKDCLTVASKMQNEQSRKILLKIAEFWQQIADKEQAAWPVAEPRKQAQRD